jgi:hypothetical protein
MLLKNPMSQVVTSFAVMALLTSSTLVALDR